MAYLGYFSATLIGVSLGLVGSGGSILVIPVLVYLFHIAPALATVYSLFIVGITALAGGLRNGLREQPDMRLIGLFIVPSLSVVYITRHWLLPALPDLLLTLSWITLSKDLALMLLFAFLMLAAALSMLLSRVPAEIHPAPPAYGLIPLAGVGVGLVTGLVGAGGGFLIIPVLVFFARLPVKKAITSSLFIIALNSLTGFWGGFNAASGLNYAFMLSITALAVGGILLGTYLGRFIEGNKLKTAFGWFVLVMGGYILLKEIFFSHL